MKSKWLWSGVVAVILTVSGVGYFRWPRTAQVEPAPVSQRQQARSVVPAKSDGDAEASEAPIEPLVVEVPWSATQPTGVCPEAAAPVYLTPQMKQGPRPDGVQPRMPYADEPTILPWPFNPLLRILEGTPLSELKLFENLKEPDGTEEAESKEPMPPAPEPPMPLPMPDYHHGHCPYLNGAYPYRR